MLLILNTFRISRFFISLDVIVCTIVYLYLHSISAVYLCYNNGGFLKGYGITVYRSNRITKAVKRPSTSFIRNGHVNGLKYNIINQGTPNVYQLNFRNVIVNIIKPTKSNFSIGLLDGTFSWINEALGGGWYVPPIPTGKKSSQILRENGGPIQTEEETASFFRIIGVNENSTLVDISNAFYDALNAMPEDMHESLHKSFSEYMRKQFLGAFEHLESFMDKGTESWSEYWNPKRDILGNITDNSDENFTEDMDILEKMPPELFTERDKKEWEKNNTRFRKMMRKLDLPGLVRITSDFKNRCIRCCKTMVPVMLMGCVPKLSPLSMSLQVLFASKFMLDGDRELILKEQNELPTQDVEPALLVRRSLSARTFVTTLIVLLHSSLGIILSKIFIEFTDILDFITPDIFKTLVVNASLILSALIYDTSNMTPLQQQKRREEEYKQMFDREED
ncbi:hypothetical protein BdWA1_001902 [Babesia duncani]|uniref:Uncharacterized protein n=1 Tax=Babesia duncani TaxID=323732 RepID=A0AAD9PKT4_9APIC|nr:hypothetical protein BdWA1_001902 [Babesia duncani]